MDFVVTAFDALDDGALGRRMQHRSAHLEGARQLAEAGRLVSAGAFLAADRAMIGSTLHMSFPSRDELQAWLDADPYTVGGVWGEVDVREIRLVRFSDDSAPR
jgi:uncharacterized protein YciI